MRKALISFASVAAALGIFSASLPGVAQAAQVFAEAAGASVSENSDNAVPASARDGTGSSSSGETSCPSRGSDDTDGDADDPRSGYVRVYDGVLSPSARGAVRDLCITHEKRSSELGSYFVRPPPPGTTLTPLERVMDSILDAFNDTSRFVEYWSREEHENVNAHCDLDEEMLTDFSKLRIMDMGHVLYLQVKKGVKGPTVVFPDRKNGWYRRDANLNAEENDTSQVEMVLVPAVNGRLLRFDGRAMHAVPRPADRYLLSEEYEHEMRGRLIDDDDDYVYPYDDEEEGGGDGVHWYDWNERALDIEDDQRRYVLLFNTWSGGPPRGVSLDSSEESSERTEEEGDSKEEIDEDGSADGKRSIEDAYLYQTWGGEFGTNLERLRCEEPSKWVETEIAQPPPMVVELSPPPPEKDDVPLRVKLMGGEGRRVHPHLHATMYLSRPEGEALAKAVQDKEVPSRYNLRQYLEILQDEG